MIISLIGKVIFLFMTLAVGFVAGWLTRSKFDFDELVAWLKARVKKN